MKFAWFRLHYLDGVAIALFGIAFSLPPYLSKPFLPVVFCLVMGGYLVMYRKR